MYYSENGQYTFPSESEGFRRVDRVYLSLTPPAVPGASEVGAGSGAVAVAVEVDQDTAIASKLFHSYLK